MKNLIVLMRKNIKAFFLLISRKSSNFAADFKNTCIMKRFIYLLILAASIVTAGCSTNEPTPKSATAIMGHTYRVDDGSDYISIYFAYSYTCVYTSNVNGTYTNVSQLTYRISGNNVDIYFDNSSKWTESARGTLFLHLIYYPSSDKLMLDGVTLNRIN